MSVLDQAVEEVKQAADAIVEEVKKVDERVRVDITDSEKLFVTKLENDFLKAQVELQQLNQRMTHLQEVAKKAQEGFVAKTQEMAKKYEVDLKDFIFNSIEQAFVKNPQPQGR
jgi:hypothetical protein